MTYMTDVSPEAVSRRARAGGRLLLQRCESCGHTCFPPRLICSTCGAETLAFFEMAGTATTIAVTRIEQTNRVIAIAELTEGVTLMGNINSDEDCARLIGRPVRVIPGAGEAGPDSILFEMCP